MSDLQIIRTHQLADLLKVSTVTVWKWEKKGILPKKIKIGPRASGFRRSEIEAWLEERDKEPHKMSA